jgi:hypothetical protein
MSLCKRLMLAGAGCAAIAMGVFLLDSSLALPSAVWWFHPRSGPPGTQVCIIGSGLGETLLVTFGGTRAEFTQAGPWVIRTWVPAGARTGPISVTTPQGTITSAWAFPVALGILSGTAE